MLIIGMTGPSGAGKSVLSSLFARYGVPCINTDDVYHALLVPPSVCLGELVDHFGMGILDANGRLDRAALAARVFAPGAEAELATLNAITHRHVLAEVRVRCASLAADGIAAVVVDAPQLFESGFNVECDHVLAVLAPPDVRLSRIMMRDGLSLSAATARLRAQKSDEFFVTRADAVINNDGGHPADGHDLARLDAEVRCLLDQWEVSYAP